MTSSVLLCNNFPSVIDQLNLWLSREAARWLIWLVDDTMGINFTIKKYLSFFISILIMTKIIWWKKKVYIAILQ